jgi:predicted naringenin-chalcone synthase
LASGVFVNAIATACPRNDFQSFFMRLVPTFLNERDRALFHRLMQRSQIEHRYCCMPVEDIARSFYPTGGQAFPTTEVRMQMYKEHAPQLAHEAASQLLSGDRRREITHIIVGSCTGFYAPGVDFDLIRSLGLRPTVQRRLIGFMGCYAGLSVLQTAYEIVRANQESKVLTVNVELSSLHLQKPTTLEQVMGFAQFADGCGAALVSSEPRGLQLHGFQSAILSDYASAITWDITDQGFEMYLDARLPRILMQHFPMQLFPQGETAALWAIHPGGKSILDVVQKRLELSDEDLAVSRGVLKRFGNMSSATILFVLKEMIDAGRQGPGYAMAFGPGLAIESMRFTRI